jgi:hypothetical protein
MESPIDDFDLLFWSGTSTEKDRRRVEGLTSEAKALAMARSIKDPMKMLSRTRAHLDKFGPVDNPFIKVMKEKGFTNDQLLIMVYPHMAMFIQKYS